MTPGDYLRKRREAAGLSIEGLVERLAKAGLAGDAVRRTQVDCESGRTRPGDGWLRILQSAFAFDPGVYLALFHDDAGVRICRGCACTENDACDEGLQMCGWAAADLCTACVHRGVAQAA